MRNELRKALSLEKSVLHEKGHCSDDSTSVVGMMKLSLIRMFHCGVNYDPPASEELQQGPARTCVSKCGMDNRSVFIEKKQESTALRTHWSTAVANTSLKSCSLSAIKWETVKIPELQQRWTRWSFFSPPSRHCTRNLRIGSRPGNLTWLWGEKKGRQVQQGVRVKTISKRSVEIPDSTVSTPHVCVQSL